MRQPEVSPVPAPYNHELLTPRVAAHLDRVVRYLPQKIVTELGDIEGMLETAESLQGQLKDINAPHVWEGAFIRLRRPIIESQIYALSTANLVPVHQLTLAASLGIVMGSSYAEHDYDTQPRTVATEVGLRAVAECKGIVTDPEELIQRVQAVFGTVEEEGRVQTALRYVDQVFQEQDVLTDLFRIFGNEFPKNTGK